MIRVLAAFVVLCAATISAPADEPPQPPSAAAIAFVEPFAANHLSGMLSKIGSRQPAMLALSQLHGPVLAAVFDAQIDQAVKRHKSTWQSNLATSWGELLPDDALTSLREEAAASPHVAAYQAKAPEASQMMQVLSADLFAKILAEVIDATVAELEAVPSTN